MLEKNTPPEQIASKCLFALDTIRAFEHEHGAKEMFHAGDSVDKVSGAIDAAVEQLAQWHSHLGSALEKARLLLQDVGVSGLLNDNAADLRVPLSVSRQLRPA